MNVKLPDISTPDIGRIDLAAFDPGAVVDAAEVVVDSAGRGLSWVVDRMPFRDRRTPWLTYAVVGAGVVAAVVVTTKLLRNRDEGDDVARDRDLRQVA